QAQGPAQEPPSQAGEEGHGSWRVSGGGAIPLSTSGLGRQAPAEGTAPHRATSTTTDRPPTSRWAWSGSGASWPTSSTSPGGSTPVLRNTRQRWPRGGAGGSNRSEERRVGKGGGARGDAGGVERESR